MKLGEVCAFHRGLTYSKKDEVTLSYNAVLRSNNVDLETGRLKLDDLKYIRDDFEIPSEKLVVKDAILMCMANGSKAHLGKVALIDTEKRFAFGGFMGMLVPNQEVIAGSYLYWVLSSQDFKQLVSSLTDGTNINNLKFSDIDTFELPLPPLAVQHEIVVRLEKDLAMVERMAKGFAALKAEADQLFKSTLKETFEEVSRGGAETRRLGDVCKTVSSRGHQIKQSEIKESGKYIVVSQSENEIEGYTDFDSPIEEGSLILFGDHTCVVKKIDKPFVVGADGTKLLKSSMFDSSYLYYALEEISVTLLDGEYRRHYSDLVEREIALVTLPTQRKIVAKLDAVRERCEKLKRAAEEGLQTAALMRKAILKEAFA